MIHVAIPAMNEAAFLPQTLECIGNLIIDQSRVHTWICVNQPDHWWEDREKVALCHNNRQTLKMLQAHPTKNLKIIDRSSRGNGWTGKEHGVGMARKVLMDAISKTANDRDIIVSMDADTWFGPGYLLSVAEAFEKHPQAHALSNPYYHRLTGDEPLDRAMLRYEIYMRYYAVNMWRIGSPYSFTALGSAIALPLATYRKIGGITAKKSGEDFYLLQKIRKTGCILNYNSEKVYPATRYSDRVFFGTGPALIKGRQGNWESYPIYDYRHFDMVKNTYDCFPMLFDGRVMTPMDDFLATQFRCSDIFEPLRRNAACREHFVRACHHKIDGLRTLQFLKSRQAAVNHSDEENLLNWLLKFHPGETKHLAPTITGNQCALDFSSSPIEMLDKIRNFLVEKEAAFQLADYQLFCQ